MTEEVRMRCGSGHDHPDVASVRECYARKYAASGTAMTEPAVRVIAERAEETREIQRRERQETERVARWKMARDEALMARGGFSVGEAAAREDGSGYAAGVIRRRAVADRHGLSREEQRIQREEDARRAAFSERRAAWAKLQPGGYAVDSRTGTNDLDFWWLERPTEGRWAGYTFVERVIGGRSNQRVSKAESFAVLDLLASLTPRQAAYAGERFGQEIGRCYRCGRHLTDEASRRAGIGPVCASR